MNQIPNPHTYWCDECKHNYLYGIDHAVTCSLHPDNRLDPRRHS